MSIAPPVNDLNAPFWEAAARGELLLPHCVASGRAFWPPSPCSPFCGGAVAWRPAAPAGIVESVVVYRRSFHPAFASLMPYGIAQLALDAGPRLQVHVPGPDAPDAPCAGDRATLVFRRLLAGAPPIPIVIKE